MVGLVIVSHSAKLAEGVVELMRGVAGAEVKIAAAGGMDLPDQPLGTDAMLIRRAIEQVYSAEGVVVLVDLGSAILSAELALEMLAPEQLPHVVIAPAPLVEGGIAAAVQAKLVRSKEQMVAEARTAFDAKLAQMGVLPAEDERPTTKDAHGAVSSAGESDVTTLEVILMVNNAYGLHARPAARFVQMAVRFDADVRIEDLTNGRGPVNAKSINAVTTLGVLHGHAIKVTASGTDARAALAAIQELAREKFGDDEDERPATNDQGGGSAQDNELIGLAASPGYAIGAARLYRPVLAKVSRNLIEDAEHEWRRLTEAIGAARGHLQQARKGLNGRGKLAEADIFEAQQLMLQDEALQEPARRAIFEKKQNAAWAFDAAAGAIAAQYDALEDEYLRARAADVRAVVQLVLKSLLGVSDTVAFQEGILVAADLTPAETAQLDPNVVTGICTALGGPMGHSAILAKSLGIPMVVGMGERILRVQDGETLIVDGTRQGRVWVNPDAVLITEYRSKISEAERGAELARTARNEPAVTVDGRRIEVAANIGSLKDAAQAVEMGAEAVGLFRTEFLFLDRPNAPTEEEQYQEYRAVAEALQGRSLLVRTLDVGGDKPLPYATMALEANPFLGLRGLRFCLAHPELFKTQLRAILRVANEFPVRMMYPMVSTVEEFRAAQRLMEEARGELQARGVSVPDRVETGIMVEVPSAALVARQFAREVDFFSIGTNDLTQYTLAAERGNPGVAALADSFHPAVLLLIANVVEAAHAEGKWVGVCGEMGGDPKAIPILVGLGVDELSMAPPLIAQAKEIVRELDFAEAQRTVQMYLE